MSTTPPRRTPLHRRIPFPVTIEVNNLLPLESTPLKWARHEHSISLIQFIHLEIVVNENQVVYECRFPRRTTHPSWKHLNEYIPVNELSTEDYETMEARLLIESPASSSDSDRILLMQIPIHPSKLSRIASSFSTEIDQTLPLNAFIITFSDDSIRVPPKLYNILVERNLVQTQVSERVNEFSRFRDDAFVALDQVSTPERRQFMERSLLDDPFLARNGLFAPSTYNVDDSDKDDDNSVSCEQRDMNGNGKVIHPFASTPSLDDDEDPIIHDDGYNSLREQQLLVRLIERESIALEQDYAAIVVQGRESLEHCQRCIADARKQTEQVVHDTVKLRSDSQRTSFLLDVQRIRLFRELRNIYPISLVFTTDQRYKIRDLEIPNELLSGSGSLSVPDDECFAALGHLSHLLIMMGKYLTVNYRYRMYYQASRSAIQNDRSKVFPLFMGRNIERDQFELGVRLLSCNVDFLVQVRNIRVSPKLHILGKVKRIYEHVIDGF
ncbi:hypothetical protein MPSEU_000295100 [Mayamaea pseudoterrestris]|nr:hypothetical protein MPSEU_000295100 [Mayamaea pseudoterrestris]